MFLDDIAPSAVQLGILALSTILILTVGILIYWRGERRND
jgi:hypothetical protein